MIKISNLKQVEALVRLLFHHLYLEFICFLGFVICDFKEKEILSLRENIQYQTKNNEV